MNALMFTIMAYGAVGSIYSLVLRLAFRDNPEDYDDLCREAGAWLPLPIAVVGIAFIWPVALLADIQNTIDRFTGKR